MAGQFQRAAVICPIKRLGSLMDLAPFIDRTIKRFGPRTVLGLSSQAQALYRNRLADGIRNEGVTVFSLENNYPKEQPVKLPEKVEQMLSNGNNLVMPVSDDADTSKSAGRATRSIPNGFLAGTDSFCEGLYSIEHFLSQEFPFGFLDLTVETSGEDVPCPIFMNGHLKLLQAVSELDRSGTPLRITENDRKPVIWTTGNDKQSAEDFFRNNGLVPKNTIAMHLTANTYYVYRNMMSKRSFLKVARHFIGRGFSILLVSGSLRNSELSVYDTSFKTHRLFSEAINSPACRLFYGDPFVEAELIRSCRLLLSGETGVAHIASAVGTPKVTIAANSFQVGHFLMTGPRDREFIVKESDFFHGKRFPKSCEVIEAMEEILQNQ